MCKAFNTEYMCTKQLIHVGCYYMPFHSSSKYLLNDYCVPGQLLGNVVPVLQEFAAHWMRWAFSKNDTNLNVFTEGTDCCDGKITNPVGLYSLVRDHTHGGLKCKGNEVGEVA